MTEQKHTPGPWNFQPCDEYAYSFEVLCEKDYYIATTHDGVRGDSNAGANARLIAAAPDLLEALRLAVRQNSLDMLMTGDEIRQCKMAIAKATGESND